MMRDANKKGDWAIVMFVHTKEETDGIIMTVNPNTI